MAAVELLLRGAAAGFAIAAPVGPVNMLCVSRTLTKGKLAGFASALGAAAADTFYGAIAGFSISFIIHFLLREQSKLRVFGGVLLMLIGVWYYYTPPESLSKSSKKDALLSYNAPHSDFVSTFLLNLTNPTIVLSFLAVLALLGLSEPRPASLTMILIGGVLAGSMAWYLILIGLTNSFRDRFDDRAMFWMNRIAGMAIGGFGVVMFALGISGKK